MKNRDQWSVTDKQDELTNDRRGVCVWVAHLLIMGTGASEMGGRCRCVSWQVGTSLSHDHSMARLMGTNTHMHVGMHKHTDRQADRQTHVPTDR